jgi:hypothetical protein
LDRYTQVLEVRAVVLPRSLVRIVTRNVAPGTTDVALVDSELTTRSGRARCPAVADALVTTTSPVTAAATPMRRTIDPTVDADRAANIRENPEPAISTSCGETGSHAPPDRRPQW